METVGPEIVISDRQLQHCGIKELRLRERTSEIDPPACAHDYTEGIAGIRSLEGTVDPPFPEYRDNVMIYHPRIKGIFRVFPDGRIRSNGVYELAS